MNAADHGLDEDSVAAIRAVLARFPAVEQAILYGSRAQGAFHTGSDIDLSLKGNALTHQDLLEIDLALDDLLLPWKFDLSLYHSLENPALIDHIERIGQALYAAEQSTQRVSG